MKKLLATLALGLAVYAVDLRGRGKSDGERFYVEAFADYLSDVDGLVRHAKSRDQELPVFVFLNAGSLHRVGPYRLHVRLARALGAATSGAAPGRTKHAPSASRPAEE